MKLSGTALLLMFSALTKVYALQIDASNNIMEITNLFGMEFQLIEPGNMLMGRLEIECPEYPDTREVAESEKWTEVDFELCRELAEKDSRPGFLVTINQAFYIGNLKSPRDNGKKSWVQIPLISRAIM